jgi:signal transduction histidine kinase
MPEMADFMQLLRKMGHDMRVPLNTVISTGDMLAEGMYDPLTPRQTKAMTRLQRNSQRMLSMLDDFVIYMKASTETLDLICNPFNPRSFLEDCVNEVRAEAEGKGLTLHLIILDDTPTQLIGDEKMLRRIVLALLWNAVSYAGQGEIRIESNGTSQQEWLISVQDSGPGISQDDLPHIFEPFWRGEERPQVPTAGAGLGLPLSLALAKLMQGDLFLKDTTTQGSTFCVRLPQI